MAKIKLLRVMPNPFSAELDHEGRCHGRTQYEPDVVNNADPGVRYVGCSLHSTAVRARNKAADGEDVEPQSEAVTKKDGVHYVNAEAGEDDHAIEYLPEPVLVPETPYYLRHLRHHDLFPADVETHLAAFGTRDGFRDPIQRIAQLSEERGAVPAPTDVWKPLLANKGSTMFRVTQPPATHEE